MSPLTLGAALLLAALLTAVVVLLTFVARGTPVRHVRAIGTERDERGDGRPGGGTVDERLDGVSPYAAASETFCEVARVLCDVELAGGHDVRVFTAGDALYDAMLADVGAARRLVTWHVFWHRPGRLADRVADALVARARAGTRTLMLLDHFGARGVDGAYAHRLREAGVEVATFRPPRWNTLYKAQQRMHVRAVVVDGVVGYTGGFGIDDRWLGDGRHEGQWRDTSVRVRGGAVTRLQAAFATNWAEATGELLLGDAVFPFDVEADGPHTAGLLGSSPSFGSTAAERFFFVSLAGARERCWLSSAYFLPDRHFRLLLREAAGRGVDVRVLTPGANTDRPSTWHAARAHYGELLDAGVRLFEYRPTMMHAKTIVVDGHWGMVGTLNFDNRSMVLNDEVGLVFWDRALGARLEDVFRDDLRLSDELTVERERRRTGPHERVRQWLAGRVERIL